MSLGLQRYGMEVTLLGSGDAMGMPVPMCGCEYCLESERRRRPGLLIESEDTRLVFELSPDIKNQLDRMDIHSVDAFFVTHYHFDHFSGIRELNHVGLEEHVLNSSEFNYNGWHGRDIDVYGNTTVRRYLNDTHSHILDNEGMNFHTIGSGDTVRTGDFNVDAFEVKHGEHTYGYAVELEGSKVVYAPDVRTIPESSSGYENADIALIEGAVFAAESHGHTDEILGSIEMVDADRTVLVNISEHLNQMKTEEIEEEARSLGYEIWDDFDSTQLG